MPIVLTEEDDIDESDDYLRDHGEAPHTLQVVPIESKVDRSGLVEEVVGQEHEYEGDLQLTHSS